MFNVNKKGGLTLFEFLGGGVSKKKGSEFFQGGPEDFLMVIFNCRSDIILDKKCKLQQQS